MKVCLICKPDKYGIKRVISFTKKYTADLDVFFGNIGDSFPSVIFEEEYDILISYISPWIIPKSVLQKTKKWNMNFHPGPPEYPGIGCFNFALYNLEDTFGSTAHLMERKVDTGKIIGVNRFKITRKEDVQSLSKKTYKTQLKLYKYIIKYIFLNDSLPECDEHWTRKPYKRNDLEKLSRIEKNMTEFEIKKRIRCTYLKGKPAPFIELYGEKFEYNPER